MTAPPPLPARVPNGLGARRRARRAEAAAAEHAAHALRDRSAAACGVGDPAAYPVAVVPSNDRALAPLPRARMRAFREHLVHALGGATRASGAPAPAPSSAAPSLDAPSLDAPSLDAPLSANGGATLGAACAACRGWCCTKGGDRAFLSAETLRRVLDTRPGQTPRDVRRAYLALLGGATYAGSCVFHTRAGCALPTDLRSDTCNRYFCGALASHRRTGGTRAFFAASDGGAITRAVFVNPRHPAHES